MGQSRSLEMRPLSRAAIMWY